MGKAFDVASTKSLTVSICLRRRTAGRWMSSSLWEASEALVGERY
jgi:hypothetical protein